MRRSSVALAAALILPLVLLVLISGSAYVASAVPTASAVPVTPAANDVPLSAGADDTTVDVLRGEMVLTHVDYRDAEKLRNIREEMRKAQSDLDFLMSGSIQDYKNEQFVKYKEMMDLVMLQIHDDGVSPEDPMIRMERARREYRFIVDETEKTINKINELWGQIEEEVKKPIKENINLNPKFTVRTVLEDDKLCLLRVGSDSIAQIKSDTKSVIIGPDSDVFIILDKTADPQVFAGVQEGTVKINAKGSSLVVVENTVVMSLKTDYEVSRRGNETTVSVYEGEVVVVHFTGENATLTELKEGREIVLEDGKKPTQESFRDVERPLEVLSVKPQDSTPSGKPVVEVLFNVPVDPSSVSGDSIIMRSGGTRIGGAVSLDSEEKLVFIPNRPLGPGVYDVTVAGGLRSVYDTALPAPASHSFTVSSCPAARGQEYILSKPRVFIMSDVTVVTNAGPGKATGVRVQRPLAMNSSNVFARLDSIEPRPSSIEADDEGNIVVEWKIVTMNPGQSKQFTINYTILSLDIDYFSAIDAASVKPFSGIGIADLPYTRPGEGIESDDPEVAEIGSGIAGDETNPYLKAQKSYGWISTNIRYDFSLRQMGGALETLMSREGVCHGYSALYAALLRSQGVPAKYVSGWSLADGESGGFHAWVEVLFPGYGWVPSDPTWNYGSYAYFNHMDSLHIPLSRMRGAQTAGAGSSYSGTTTVDFNSTAVKFELTPGELDDPSLEKLYYTVLLAGMSRQLPYTPNGSCAHSDSQALLQQWLELRGDGEEDPGILESACSGSASGIILDMNRSLGAIKEWNEKQNTATAFPSEYAGLLANISGWNASGGPGSIKESIGRIGSALEDAARYGHDCEKVAREIEPVYDDLQHLSATMSSSSGLDASVYGMTPGNKSANNNALDFDELLTRYFGSSGAVALVALGLFILVLFLIWIASMLHCIMRKDLGARKKILWLAVIVILNLLGTFVYLLAGRKKKENDGKRAPSKTPKVKSSSKASGGSRTLNLRFS